MELVVEINGLGKSYEGKPALHDISLEVRKGTCFGLLGPNGAGKSTTMKILTGILPADQGTVQIFGVDALHRPDEVRMKIGYVPQGITLYEKLSATDNLVFFGEMYGLRGAELKQRIHEVLEEVGLADRARDAVSTFSGGMKRRINIAAALLHRPQLLILDEPTVGIDPQSRNHIFEMIRHLKDRGVTLIYSTHYMEEVETLCDDVAIIDHGQVVMQGGLQQLLDQFGGNAVYLEAEALSEPPHLPDMDAFTPHGRGFLLETNAPLQAIRQVAEQLLAREIAVSKLEIVRPSLETVFLNLTGESLRDS
jgi:ABC-2 type transport system ATP-binding protein